MDAHARPTRPPPRRHSCTEGQFDPRLDQSEAAIRVLKRSRALSATRSPRFFWDGRGGGDTSNWLRHDDLLRAVDDEVTPLVKDALIQERELPIVLALEPAKLRAQHDRDIAKESAQGIFGGEF